MSLLTNPASLTNLSLKDINKNNPNTLSPRTPKNIEVSWRTGKLLSKRKRNMVEVSNKNTTENTTSPNISTDSIDINTTNKTLPLKVEAIRARLFLKICNREGKNNLIENYIARLASVTGSRENLSTD